MLNAARGVRERRESRFRARSAITSRRARKSKNREKSKIARGGVQLVFRARVFARTLLYVFFVTSGATFFRWIFSNYVEDYLKQLYVGLQLRCT